MGAIEQKGVTLPSVTPLKAIKAYLVFSVILMTDGLHDRGPHCEVSAPGLWRAAQFHGQDASDPHCAEQCAARSAYGQWKDPSACSAQHLHGKKRTSRLKGKSLHKAQDP